MNLLIAGVLARPPSSVHCFRDITLYTRTFTDINIILTCRQHNVDRTWQWLKRHGAFDYVDDIVGYGDLPGLSIAPDSPCNIQVNRLTEHGLNGIISRLSVYTATSRYK